MKVKDKMKEMYLEYSRIKHPLLPDYARTYPNYFSKTGTTNGLTQCIVAFIKLNGWMAERVGTSGRYVDEKKIVHDTLGRNREIGTGKWIPGTGTAGRADITAKINGQGVEIEVKNIKTRDRLSEAQKAYMRATEATGGIYYVATDLQSFSEWFDKRFKKNPDYIKVYKIIAENKSLGF